MKKKVASSILATAMIFGSVTQSTFNVFAQEVVKEGTAITVTTKVNSMKEILNANIQQYYEDEYMRITKVQNDIYQIDEETSTHVADGPTNNPSSIYLIVGKDSAAMIDAGNGVYNANFSEAFMKQVIDTLVGDKELKVLITHSHGDHIGALRDYENRIIARDVPVYIHEDDIVSLNDKVKTNYEVIGLKDDDVVKAGDRTLTVVSEYGHTDGSVVYIDEEDEVIFSGDTIGSGSVWLSDDDDLIEFNESIDKLNEILQKMNNPVFYAGHRWQQSNGAAHANETTAVNEMGKEYVLEMDALLYDIVSDQYDTTDPYYPYAGHIGIYSQTSDLNGDGIIPGIVATADSVELLKEQMSSSERALSRIIIPRYEADGTKKKQHMSYTLKSHLSVKDIVALKDEDNKTINVDVQLKDVNLISDYKNCVDEPGTSYYNMLSYYANVLQVQELVNRNEDYTIIDNKGHEVNATYVNELVGLLTQINDFDPTTDLQYDWDSAYDTEAFENETWRGGTDVIATSQEGNVTLRFHIDAHGYWGYDLGMHDSITGIVMGYDADYAYEYQYDLTTRYGNFFVIKMLEDECGTWYMLRNTDLENPMMYVSKDGKEAFMIDVDFYGENVLNNVIKSVIGEKCESLKIFCTHNHGDHCYNLDVIAQDERLQDIVTMYWPENEPHTTVNGKDVVEAFEIKTLADMEKFTVAGVEFQFIEIPNEHTPGGGQLADLTHKVIYSGDTLGAQIQYGGTNFYMSNAQNWLLGAQKVAQYIEENGIRYNIGGHTPYLNNPQYASWVITTIQSAYDQIQADPNWAGGLIITENGEVVSQERAIQLQSEGLTDREVLNVCSITFRNNLRNEYEIVEGKDSSWTKDSNDTITIATTVESDKLTTVFVDNEVIDEKYYSVDKELAIITLNVDYLETLNEGQHNVLLQFTNGVALATLTVEAKISTEPGDLQEPTTPEDPTISVDTPITPDVPTNTQNPTTNTTVVSTGDQTQYIAYAYLALMSVLGIRYVLNVRRNKNEQ